MSLVIAESKLNSELNSDSLNVNILEDEYEEQTYFDEKGRIQHVRTKKKNKGGKTMKKKKG